MKICTMKIEDYDRVYRLWIRTPGMGLTNLDDSKEGIEKYLKRNPSTCFVAKEEERLLGVILGGHDGRRGYIYHMAVEESERKKGIGTALLEASLEAFRREGITKTALVAYDSNEEGNEFWERRDFVLRKDLVYRTKDLVDLEVILP
ncbi:GNAT family N-acetyltransferase [Qiania dongpingensis]|uniref:GNAT family N-acetyltransferase n=1 Tax=Qiania dongpingensis TaxID=2763669 RepID=A0A7G9G668_9FIRM|nr:GNAT family N-acetyltransferase [Qiania dongpingensis]QNM06300.1 GNAT family N-acetyltransferase [Qiania dongpingensis]